MQFAKNLLSITKPGIVIANIITTSGGFIVASHGRDFNYFSYFFTILGMFFIISCGCVFNNYIDQDIDQLMQRTKKRVLAQKLISLKTAFYFGIILGIIGFIILLIFTNILSLIIALFGLFVYIILYSFWLKRCFIYAIIIGSISGGIPPVVGYCAATNSLDKIAIILFIILFFWQIPHSYSIGILYIKDYDTANIPIIYLIKNIKKTKIYILLSSLGFIFFTTIFYILEYKKISYILIPICIGIVWILIICKGFFVKNNIFWARNLFLITILTLIIINITMLIL